MQFNCIFIFFTIHLSKIVCGMCYSTFFDAVFAGVNACVVAREMLCAMVLSMVCVTKNLCKQKEKTKFYFFVCVIKSWLINC